MCLCLKQLKTHNISIRISRKLYTQNKTRIHSYLIKTFGFLQTSTNRLYTINLMMKRVSFWCLFHVIINLLCIWRFRLLLAKIIRYSFCWWINANFCSPTSIVAFQNGWAGLFWDATELQKYAWLVNIYLLF